MAKNIKTLWVKGRVSVSLFCSLLLLFGQAQFLFAQSIDVVLGQASAMDDQAFHVSLLTDKPNSEIELPEVGKSIPLFLQIFYSADLAGEKSIEVLVLEEDSAQVLYIDKNNDLDLTNDGPPEVFPFHENELIVALNSTDDPEQIARISLTREPAYMLEDTTYRSRIFDQDGKLQPMLFRLFQKKNSIESREKNTFFFDSRLMLRRGSFLANGKEVGIALMDYNQNGLFNDIENSRGDSSSVDRVIIDLNGNGLFSTQETEESFMIKDIFEIDGERYQLENVDPFGASLTISKTDKSATFYLVNAIESPVNEGGQVGQGILKPDFWDLNLSLMDSTLLDLDRFRGKYVLLNFWGEWCAPCLEEIPALKNSLDEFSDKLEIIGLLYSDDHDKVRTLLEKNEMNWPQVVVTDKLIGLFKVVSYPTNILILPNGKDYLIKGKVTEAFFQRNVK